MEIQSNIPKRALAWLTAGYDLFIEEGPEGLQVERLARILRKNKSGFYHFFGERSTYMEFLIQYHLLKLPSFIDDLKKIQSFHPDFFQLLEKYRDPILFNSQLVRNRHISLFNETLVRINAIADQHVLPRWIEFLELQNDPALALRYYELIRDVTYARLTPKNFAMVFFMEAAFDAKAIAHDLISAKKKGPDLKQAQ